MSRVRNILFVMADQLRADYLSCYGHRTLATPNIDALAARGTRFTNCYVQGPVCGPSRKWSPIVGVLTASGRKFQVAPWLAT